VSSASRKRLASDTVRVGASESLRGSKKPVGEMMPGRVSMYSHQLATMPAAVFSVSASMAGSKAGSKGGSKGDMSGKEYMLTLPGIISPTGFFDPLKLSDAPTLTVSEAKRFREAELTHGRVSMLATVGWLVAEEYHPLFGGQIGGPAFGHFQEVEEVFPQFWELVLLVIALCEGYRISVGWNNPKEGVFSLKDDYVPGDIGFDPLGLAANLSEDELYALKTKEINNGRIAMISIAGYAAQEGVDRVTIWKGLVEEKIVPAVDADLLPY